VDLGDLTITETISKTGRRVVVRGKDGIEHSSPQTVLDKLWGALTFDPLAFARLPPAEQADTVRRLVGLDLSKVDHEIERLFVVRRALAADAKSTQAAADRAPCYPGAPTQEVSIADLLKTRTEAAAVNLTLERKRAAVEELRRKSKDAKAKIERLTLELDAAKVDLANIVDNGKAAAKELAEALTQIAMIALPPEAEKEIQKAGLRVLKKITAIDAEREAFLLSEIERGEPILRELAGQTGAGVVV
jgi:hypothetical protein